jgi:hypothetical protein
VDNSKTKPLLQCLRNRARSSNRSGAILPTASHETGRRCRSSSGTPLTSLTHALGDEPYWPRGLFIGLICAVQIAAVHRSAPASSSVTPTSKCSLTSISRTSPAGARRPSCSRVRGPGASRRISPSCQICCDTPRVLMWTLQLTANGGRLPNSDPLLSLLTGVSKFESRRPIVSRMFTIRQIAENIARARERSLPGRQSDAVNDLCWQLSAGAIPG